MAKKTKKIITTTYLPVSTMKKLRIRAAETGKSMSEIVNKSVLKTLKSNK